MVLALSVPLAALTLRPLWGTSLLQQGGFAVGLIWALRVIRPRLHHGSVALLAAGLTGAVLITATATLPSRQLLAALALIGLLLLDSDLRRDPDAGPMDRALPGWVAGGVWLVLAGTWAHDLRLLDRGLGVSPGFNLDSLPWVGLLAMPLAVPAFALSRRRLASVPAGVEPEPDAVPAGTGAEVLGWLVVLGGLAAALTPATKAGIDWVGVAALATAALMALVWSRIRTSPGRATIAHLLLIAAVWAGALRTGRPILTLAPLAVAAALAVTPLLGGRRSTGVVGWLLLPLLAIEAATRHTSLLIEVQRMWTSGWVASAARLPVGAVAAAGAWLAVRAAGRRRRQAAAALEPTPGQDAPPAPLDAPDAGLVLEALGWTLLTMAAGLALLPVPLVPTSLALLAAITAIAATWAPLGGSVAATTVASLLLVLELWLGGWWLGPGWPALVAPTAALLLSQAPHAARRLPRAAPRAGWVGFVLFPAALADALIARQAPALPAAVLLAAFGLLHLIAPPQAPAWTRAAGPPGVLLAGYLLATGLTGAALGTAPLPATILVAALAAALIALSFWAAFLAGPAAVSLEALLGPIALLAATRSPLALLPLLILAAGRQPRIARTAALALVAAGAVGPLLGPGEFPIVAAAAALTAGGAALLRPTPLFEGMQADVSALEVTLESLRRIGPAAIAAGALVLLVGPRADGSAWLPETLWPAAPAAVVTIAAVWVRVRGRPSFLAPQTVVAALLVAVGTIALALLWPSAAGNLAPVAALVSLAAAVIAARRLSPDAATVIWGIAALAAPLAMVPLAGGPGRWPVALLAAGEVILLGTAARRRTSPILASWTLWLGLLVTVWLTAAVLARLHPAADPMLYSAAVALGAALAGGLALWGGSAWLGAPVIFIQPFIQTCLWLGAAAAILSAGIGPMGTPLDMVVNLLALAAVGGLAAALALQQSAGFPWLIAGAVLVAGYVALRLRTSWLGLLAAGDGLVAVGAALLATLAERRLRPPQPEPPPGAAAPPLPDPRLPPDDFPVPRAPGERELGWLATALAAASVFPVFQQSIPVHWGAVGPLLGSLLLLLRARQGGPTQALAAAALFNTTIVVALTRLQVASYAAYAVPIGGCAAIWVQIYRHRLGFDAAARAVPPLAVGGVCALQMFQTPALMPAALLGAVGLLMLPASRVWRERSYLWIGLCCVAMAAVALVWLAPDDHSAPGMLARLSTVNGLRVLPALSLLVAAIAALMLARSDRWVDSPLEILHDRVRDGLGVAAALTTAALIFAPVRSPIDVALALASVAATGALALRLAPRLPAGWPVLLAGAGATGAYAYLRLRSGWLDGWQHLDGFMAVAGGVLLVLVERLLRRASPASVQPATPGVEGDPDRWPFGVREVRILATAITCLSALAFLQPHTPAGALAPLLAALFFLLRIRAGHPIHGVLAVVYLNATLALFLSDRNVTSAAAYALPLAVSLTLLLHHYRGHLGSDEAVVRTLPAIAAAGACLYDAVAGRAVLLATAELAAIGFALLLLSRRWQMRAYLPVGLAAWGRRC